MKSRAGLFVLVVAMGIVLRLISLNQSFWLDEATSVTVARDFSVIDILLKFSPGDFHPPLYYLVLKFWLVLFGTSEISARLLSVVFGTLGIAGVYTIGGIIPAALLSTSGLHIYYSQEARMYAMETALCVFLIITFTRRRWTLFSLTLFLLGMTDYLPLLLLPALWLYGIVTRRKQMWWKGFLLSHTPLVLGYLLWLPVLYTQLTSGINYAVGSGWSDILGRTDLKGILLLPVKFIIGRISFENKLIYGAVALGAGILFTVLSIKGALRKNGRIITLWLVVPIVLAVAIGCVIPVFSYFRLIFVLPAVYLLMGRGIDSLGSKAKYCAFVLVLALNLITSLIYLFNTKYQREDWRGVARYVQASGNNYQVLFPANSQMEAIKYYAKGSMLENKIFGPQGFSSGAQTVWLSRYVQTVFDPNDLLREEIEGVEYQKTGEYDFNGVVFWKYMRL